MSAEREALRARISALITRLADGSEDASARDALLAEVARHQAEHVAPFARLCRARSARFDPHDPGSWPAVPTDLFRVTRLAGFEAGLEIRTFRTSGTTSGARGVHALRDLSLYDQAARAAAMHALFRSPIERLVVITPPPSDAPDSSLSYMLGRFEEWLRPAETIWATEGALPDPARALDALHDAEARGLRTAVLGTSFALVHLDDRLGTERVALPAGSLVMQTGGFKGRTRELSPADMRAMLTSRLGVPMDRIVSEYGMTELSSQLYGRSLIEGRASDPERLWHPGWVRAVPVDPDTLRPVPDGEPGILRIDDLANLDSVCSIQTSDLARREPDGAIVLLGRAPGATPRGCSLAVEEALA